VQDGRQHLSDALVQAFLPEETSRLVDHNIATVVTKMRKDFGKDVWVVLHVDEYASNLPGVQSLLSGCSSTMLEYGFHVVVILTGMQPVNDIPMHRLGSPYQFERRALNPLIDQTERVNAAFAKAIGVQNGVSLGQGLLCLLDACGGYPVSIVAAAKHVNEGVDEFNRNRLRTSGEIDSSILRRVYANLCADLMGRYSESRWIGTIYRNTGVDVSVNSKTLLKRILLYALTEIPVKEEDQILREKAGITFAHLRERGNIDLIPVKNGGGVIVTLPLLAMSVMNSYLHVVPWGAIDDPFVTGFAAHERLAMASLAVRVNALIVARGANQMCTLADLRPGSRIWPADEALAIRIPESVNCMNQGTKVDEGRVSGEPGNGSGPLPDAEGTMWITALDERVVDGVAIFSGTFNGKEVIVFFASQSKSLDPTFSATKLTNILTRMEES